MRSKEILHPLLDVGGNMLTKDVERMRYFVPFFHQSLIVRLRTDCSEGTQPPELEDRDNFPIILEEMVNGLLHHLDRHNSMGLDGIHLNVLREPKEVPTEQPSAIYFLYKQIDATITLCIMISFQYFMHLNQ